jgi:hypothetical protein
MENWLGMGCSGIESGSRWANTGPAVAHYDIPRLFEPFRRLAQDRVGSDRGAGLGLSADALIDQHRRPGRPVLSPG